MITFADRLKKLDRMRETLLELQYEVAKEADMIRFGENEPNAPACGRFLNNIGSSLVYRDGHVIVIQ